MADSCWKEIANALEGNRKELILRGSLISDRIKVQGLDPVLFTIKHLNYLEISETCLETLDEDVKSLPNLLNLVLRANKLQSLPSSIGDLKKLKLLDISQNNIEVLPDEVVHLSSLETLTVSHNKLQHLPTRVAKLRNLHVIHISHNNLEEINGLFDEHFEHLYEINAKGNNIGSISSNISKLSQLKNLDMSDNSVESLPGELADCHKLKDLDLRKNKLKDKRLAKLIDQAKAKSIIDYVRKSCPRTSKKEDSNEADGGKKSKKQAKKKNQKDSKNTVEDITHLIKILHCTDGTKTVRVLDAVQQVRPHIVCCIVRSVVTFMTKQHKFKKFIIAQTKLHDTVCDKRNAATIATHDLNLVKGDMIYTAREPDAIKMRPLFQHKEMTANDLVVKLRREAEEFRKEHKRNTLSGIHKYLDLLNGKSVYPCLVDSEYRILSFPPITNSDISKVSSVTQDIFVEVTSSISLAVCKTVMDALLQRMTTLRMSTPDQADNADSSSESDEEDDIEFGNEEGGSDDTGSGYLIVEQVKITDEEGSMKQVYPSRTDLNLAGVKIIRNY